MPIFTVENTESLSVSEQYALITAAQSAPVSTVTETEDGEIRERTVYGATPESEAAVAELTLAFLPAVRAAARQAGALDEEDAEGVALEAFVLAVREYDLASDVPFAATIRPRLQFAVRRASRTSDVISVKHDTAWRYWGLMHKHGHDVEAAYAECSAEANGFDPYTFLVVHRLMSGVDSLDAATGDEFAGPSAAVTPGPEEEIVQRHLVAWLLDSVTDRQASICRLAYGFNDLKTESLRVLKGYREGDVLEDAQVAHCLDMARSTVNRDRGKALAAMRVLLDGLAAEEA